MLPPQCPAPQQTYIDPSLMYIRMMDGWKEGRKVGKKERKKVIFTDSKALNNLWVLYYQALL